MRYLLLADQRDWAFDVGHRGVIRYCGNGHQMDIHYLNRFPFESLPPLDGYDRFFAPYRLWHALEFIPLDRCFGALRSSCWHSDRLADGPDPEDVETVNRFRGFQVVTQRNYNELHERCPRVRYLPNPIDLRIFDQITEQREIVACWSGNARRRSHDGISVKGIEEVILPACRATGTRVLTTEFEGRRPHAEMPAWYRQASVLLMASLFEGCSRTLLESMASGLAVITTETGTAGEMHRNMLEHFGSSGIILIPRSAEAMADAIYSLTPDRIREMGRLNRLEIEARWSWDVWAPRWREFLES
jgi:glycosyltransferase involved in cell wall biosynthesis